MTTCPPVPDRRSLLRTLAGAGCLALTMAALYPAAAADLESAKRSGLVGERPDGYLGLVKGGAPAEVQAMVAQINAERRAAYAQIATRTGASVRDVGILAGKRLIAQAAPGTYVMDASGQWRRR